MVWLNQTNSLYNAKKISLFLLQYQEIYISGIEIEQNRTKEIKSIFSIPPFSGIEKEYKQKVLFLYI